MASHKELGITTRNLCWPLSSPCSEPLTLCEDMAGTEAGTVAQVGRSGFHPDFLNSKGPILCIGKLRPRDWPCPRRSLHLHHSLLPSKATVIFQLIQCTF